ncbi:MAG: shikimate dehydrogenase family protein, partial [Candidatus Thorarchaeota archaeon]
GYWRSCGTWTNFIVRNESNIGGSIMKQFVLIGYPLGHSLSPLMHNAALLEMGLESDYRYDLQPTLEHRLQNCVKAIKDDSLSGANITIPYKSEILRHLHEVSEEASVIGSVNGCDRILEVSARALCHSSKKKCNRYRSRWSCKSSYLCSDL